MKQANKIYATLVCLLFVATALPSVSATATIGTLSTVDDGSNSILIERNCTAADISELIGVSLDKDDTLYVSYYNVTDGANVSHTSFAAYEDSDDVVWFNLSIIDMNATNRKCYFDDETITASNYDDAEYGLYVNETISDTVFAFVVTIPSDVQFTYDKYSFEYDDENFTVYNNKGKEVDNLTSFTYCNTSGIYTLDLNDTSEAHQIVVVAKDIHDTSVAAIGKRVTVHKLLWFDTKVTYNMNTEATDEYNMFTSEDGYIAFDVYNDYGGYLGKYFGGKTPFRMTDTEMKYGKPSWYGLKTTLTTISTKECTISGIGIGLIERIWISEKTGAEDNDEVIRDNYGVVASKGAATTVSGLSIMTMWTSRTPEAVIDTGSAQF